MEKYQQTASSLFGSLKNAVLGNPVTREYQIGKQVASFGPGLSWKVFEGKKKTTGQEVSVLVLEKKLIDSYEKRDREPILEMFRKGPQQLAKLRHPRLLTVQHTIEESRDSLAFATEPIFASLANVLGKNEMLPQNAIEDLRTYELFDVEKVYGLLQVAEGLTFLHNDVKLIEGNVTPHNVIITKDGQWKLAGFNFSVSLEKATQQTFSWESRMPIIAKPELNYLAPEYILCQACEVASDMYSFGCLVSAVYNRMKTPFDAGNNIEAYKKCIEQFCRLGSDHMKEIPIVVRDHVKSLLNIAPGVRPDANQTIKHVFFDDVAAMTLKYLHTLVQRDDMTKSQFFKSLHRVLSKLPKRVIHQRVLPHLFLEFPNHAMIPFVLPNVLLIAENCSNQEYVDLVFPELKKIFAVQEPVQVLLIFMQKMELLLKKTPQDDVKSSVLPMVFRALESQSTQIQELVLSIIPNFVSMIDYISLKHSILPRVKNLILKTSTLSVRVNALVCIGKIIECLDKFLVMDEVFPILPQIPSKEPAVLMGILGIYKKTLAHKKMSIEIDYLATKGIPFLLPLAVDSGLNITQFNNFMSVIREMLDRVDQEHRTKLEQLSKMQEQQKSTLEFSKAVEQSRDMQEMLDKVDKLVLGSPEKVQDSSDRSEFSKIFGNITDDTPRGKKQAKDLLTNAPEEAKTSMNSSKEYTTSSLPSNKQTSSSIQEEFQPLPFSTKPTETSRAIPNQSVSFNKSTVSNNRTSMESDSLLQKRISNSSANSSLRQQQKPPMSAYPANSWANSSSLDSLMMKNAGIQSTAGISNSVNQYQGGMENNPIGSNFGLTSRPGDMSLSSMGQRSIGQSSVYQNQNSMGQSSIYQNQNSMGQRPIGQPSLAGQRSFNSSLDPFSTNQGSPNLMQGTQQPQSVPTSMMDFSQLGMQSSYNQSKPQHSSIYQGGAQNNIPMVSQQQNGMFNQMQSSSGMLMPQTGNISNNQNNEQSNLLHHNNDSYDLLI